MIHPGRANVSRNELQEKLAQVSFYDDIIVRVIDNIVSFFSFSKLTKLTESSPLVSALFSVVEDLLVSPLSMTT